MKRKRTYKLFVDDMREIPCGWIGSRTVSEAIAILHALPIREISLDHDILYNKSNGDTYQALSLETFRGVLYYIMTMKNNTRPKIRIHTSNAGAALVLCQMFKLNFEKTYRHYDLGGF